MKTKVNVKAGGWAVNRCESLRIRTGVRGGLISTNRCETLAR